MTTCIYGVAVRSMLITQMPVNPATTASGLFRIIATTRFWHTFHPQQ
jgi:hypothetical protein